MVALGTAYVAWNPVKKQAVFFTPYDPEFIAEMKREVPRRYLKWDGQIKAWYVGEFYAEAIIKLADKHFPMFSRELYDAEKSGKFPPSSKTRKPGIQISKEHKALYVLPGAPPEVISAAYRALSKLYHPDAGGSSVKMIELNKAYEVLRKL